MQDNSRDRRAYGVPSVNTDFTYDNLGRVTDIDAGPGGVKFAYSYVDDENNLYRKTFAHRSGDQYNRFLKIKESPRSE